LTLSDLQPAVPQAFRWIDTAAELADFCHGAAQCDAVAVDTEFMRSNTFFPIAGLIQIAVDNDCVLIDPLAFDDLTPLKTLMADTGVVKVLHSCSEDLDVFMRILDQLPTPLFDTQVAAALCGSRHSLGFSGLVEALLAVDLPKEETRSDWLQRPLTDAQQQYAAWDVTYLLQCYRQLLQRLGDERQPWVLEEGGRLIEQYLENQDASKYYLRIKGIWKLNRRQLELIQRLSCWRENEARQRDKPRGYILKDKALFDLVQLMPRKVPQLRQLDGVGPAVLGRYGDWLCAQVAEVKTLPDEVLPKRLPKPLPSAAGEVMKQLKEQVNSIAEDVQVAPEILARKKDLEPLLRSGWHSGDYHLPASLQGWRKALVGDALLAILAGDGQLPN